VLIFSLSLTKPLFQQTSHYLRLDLLRSVRTTYRYVAVSIAASTAGLPAHERLDHRAASAGASHDEPSAKPVRAQFFAAGVKLQMKGRRAKCNSTMPASCSINEGLVQAEARFTRHDEGSCKACRKRHAAEASDGAVDEFHHR